ncbi:Protein NPC2 like protein [Trachymyrmex zeteki]|uniref:Protein NPC2 like protein n=1 Tax=Mycetomoellerius zeteki TaxID=64791 RepID=A0A151X6M1_9HYME|nr:PREDICTED: protein NPC2 homolog [Trachymyrmex zeteki]KYQ56007.1 Protein NPC2 like protein [Trachymyrmex zeteki]
MVRMAIVVFTLFYALCCFAPCLAFEFDDCGSTLGKFTEVVISECSTSDEKCNFVRGTNATMSINFKPNKDISHIVARVYGILNILPVPFPLSQPDVCKDPNAGLKCPLHKDQEYHYMTMMSIKKNFPSVNVKIKWEFVNENNEKIVCIEFPAKVT